VRQDHRELVTTHSESAVATAHDRGCDLADGAEKSVAGIVAIPVVDSLQSIDIEEQERERGPRPLGILELTSELVLEGTMVAEAGQAVEEGRPPRLAVQLLHLGPLQVE
jgi:hypothetical protein